MKRTTASIAVAALIGIAVASTGCMVAVKGAGGEPGPGEDRSGPSGMEDRFEDRFDYGYQRSRIEELLEGERDPAARARLLMELADLAERIRASAFSRMVELEGRGDPGARRERQQLERVSGVLLDEELKLLGLVARDYPDSSRRDEVLYRLGTTMLDRDRPDQALAHIRALLGDYPTSPYAAHGYLAFADHYFEREDLDQAIKLYEKALALDVPDATPLAHFKLGWCRLNRGENEEALASFAAAARAAEELGGAVGSTLREEALKDLVRAYVRAGEVEEAEEFFVGIGEEMADDLLGRLGEAYFDEGRFEDSILINRRVADRVECSPLQARAHVAVFEARLFLGRIEDLKAEGEALVEVYVRLSRCVAPEDMVEFAEVGAVAKETLKAEAKRYRAEYEVSAEPAAIQMADELEALAESF